MSLLNSFTVSGDTITTDLSKERPIWRLSCYAPGKDPPAQLIDGKDISPEELRFRAWELNMQGMGNLFANEAAQLEAAIDTQVNNILRDIPGAVRFMTESNKNSDGYRSKTPTGMDQPAAPTSAFEAPKSAFGAPTQPTSAFGAPAQPTSAFGAQTQPTGFSQPQQPTSAFGQPTALGGGSTFGTTSSLGSKPAMTSAFGQPSFGKPAFGQPAFGQTSFGVSAAPAAASTTTPAFGQTAFSNSTPTPAFSQPQGVFGMGSTQTASGFGKPTFGTPAFGQTGFGQPTSAFANTQPQSQTTNAFGQQQPATSAFAQPTGVFGTQAQQPVNAFSQPQQQQPTSAFAQPQQPVSAFAASSAPAAAPPAGIFSQSVNAFAQQVPTGQQQPQNAFGQPTSGFGQQTSAFGSGSGFANLLNPQVPTAPMGSTAAGASMGKWDDPPIQYRPEEIEAFKAPEFVLGRIPLVPPPPELCR